MQQNDTFSNLAVIYDRFIIISRQDCSHSSIGIEMNSLVPLFSGAQREGRAKMKKRANTRWRSIVLPTLLFSIPLPALTAEPQPPLHAASCIEVEVNGYRALPYDCYQQLMSPRTQKKVTKNAGSKFDADISKRQPNQIGLYSQSAFKNRMGNHFGKSAQPQRQEK
ncbi:hypothetical protein ACI6PW_18080 [Serratia marcescens]